MPVRFYLLLCLFALLFLFYPGDTPYLSILAQNREAFESSTTPLPPNPPPFPILLPVPAEITAEGVYVVEVNNFTPILMRNEHASLYPASTTKIITALVAFDLYQTDTVIQIKDKLEQEGQLMGLFPGERITIENLLYGALVYSGNDAAYALASEYGVEKFVEKMNEKAQSLGMKDSHFKNPPGLDDPEQRTTAFDLALAARALLENKYLRKIVSTKEITISDVDFRVFHHLTNVNKLLGDIPGIGGLKTGYTEAAGENLVSFYRVAGHDFIIVIMKSKDRFEDTRRMVAYLLQNVQYVTLH